MRNLFVGVALIGLAACSQGQAVARCEEPPSPLRLTSNAGEEPELTPIVRFRVSSTGVVTRGDEKFDDVRLKQSLEAAGRAIPSPIYVFEVDQATSCSRIANLRSLLSDAPLCKSGQCYEGDLPAHWRAMSGT